MVRPVPGFPRPGINYQYVLGIARQLGGLKMALIREAGKLPPPTISVPKPTSHISSSTSSITKQNRIEIERGLIPWGSSVMVVDDVLATGRTLSAVLQLLGKAGIRKKDISVVAIAEFPAHHGRELLRKCGFGAVNIQSLLVFDGF